MKHDKETMESKIDAALHSMDNHRPASPGPYFMTRLNSAIRAGKDVSGWDKLYAVISRPMIAFGAIALILILNIFIITSYQDNDAVRFQADSNNDWQSYPTAASTALYDVENNIEP